MEKDVHVEGKLVALHWNKDASTVTMAVDTTKLLDATAEVEDATGVTHRIEVLADWDADYLVGKEVAVKTTDRGVLLSPNA